MAVKILGGIAKGFSLLTPKGNLVRPTSVVLRRKIFDTYQNWENWIFIDACAGTGAVGLEAWSRGAKKIYFIEKSDKVFPVLVNNLQKIQNSYAPEMKGDEFTWTNTSIESWLINFKETYVELCEEDQRQCLLFLDPPYGQKQTYEKVIFRQILKEKWFKGWLWIESDEKKGIPSKDLEAQGIHFYDFITQSDSYLGIIKVATH